MRFSLIFAALSWGVWMLTPTMLGDRWDLPEALMPQSRLDVDLGIEFGGGIELVLDVHVDEAMRDVVRGDAWQIQWMVDDAGLDAEVRASGEELHVRATDSDDSGIIDLVGEYGLGYVYVGRRAHGDDIDHTWQLTEARASELRQRSLARAVSTLREHGGEDLLRPPEVLPGERIRVQLSPAADL